MVETLHRHHKKCQGHRFSIGVYDGDRFCGACIVGRPVARENDQYNTAEVTRLVTDGTKNACSFLYARAARAAEAMGFIKIGTYILEEEPGVTLIAAGWTKGHKTQAKSWNSGTRKGRREDQPQGPKIYWYKEFKQ